jgi:hypothetical protein
LGSLIAAAARALAAGDPLGALKRVALRDDAPSLALRGIAMAQLGDFTRARTLMRRARHAFGAAEALARARCVVAEGEIALASRELGWPAKALEAAGAILEAHGDRVNAAHARLLGIRRLVLIGRLAEAGLALAGADPAHLPPASRAMHDLLTAVIATRQLRTQAARAALARADLAAHEARIPALVAEVAAATRALEAPAARLIAGDCQRLVLLEEVETLFNSATLIVDACRHHVRRGSSVVRLARRPVLFALARALAEAWPGSATREALVARAFRGRRADESHRARLRVEIGRLRALLRGIAAIEATPGGFAWVLRGTRQVAILAPPIEDRHAPLLALLADGELWSSSALALALGAGQRTMQRALDSLAAQGKVQAFGRGRSRRWLAPQASITTSLLLPALLPGG